VQTYPAREGVAIWHFDLYRLEAPEELVETGIEEALLAGITLIEWPEIARAHLPDDVLDITIAMGDDPAARVITFTGPANTWRDRLEALTQDFIA
jgi:tRNA threonylcarbamoyladenosine biosynthesis protein TsaE